MAGVLTRAKRSLAHEYTQQRQNDVVIKDVIADLSEGMEDKVVDLTAPDSQHTLGGMDTLNVNLGYSVFGMDGWQTQKQIRQAPGFEATHREELLLERSHVQCWRYRRTWRGSTRIGVLHERGGRF